MKKIILLLAMAVSFSASAKNADCDFIAQQQYEARMAGAPDNGKAKSIETYTEQCLSGVRDRLAGEKPALLSAFVMSKLAKDTKYLTDKFYRDGATSVYISYLRGYSETD